MAAAHSSSPADTQDSLGELTRRIVLAFALLAVMATMPLYQRLALYEFDFLSSLTAPAPPDAGILVVGLDEASLAQLGVAPPLPRRLHAQLVRALTDAGAAALGVDMLFAEPQGRRCKTTAHKWRSMYSNCPLFFLRRRAVLPGWCRMKMALPGGHPCNQMLYGGCLHSRPAGRCPLLLMGRCCATTRPSCPFLTHITRKHWMRSMRWHLALCRGGWCCWGKTRRWVGSTNSAHRSVPWAERPSRAFFCMPRPCSMV